MRASAPLATSIGLVFVMLGLAIASTAATGAAARAPAARPTAPLYNILLDKDDKLCSTLRNFYNRHLYDRERPGAGYVEDQFGRELGGTGVELVTDQNWQPQIDTFSVQLLPGLDVYNDGRYRTVLLLDRSPSGNFPFSTQILILKPNVDAADALQLSAVVDTFHDPRVEQNIDFGRGGSSLGPLASVYRILEVPPSKERALPGFGPLPAAIGDSAQRVLRYGNRIYFVARTLLPSIDPFMRSGARIYATPILAYTVAPSGNITNVCFLEMTFTMPPFRK